MFIAKNVRERKGHELHPRCCLRALYDRGARSPGHQIYEEPFVVQEAAEPN